jgi:hypothetical protein
MAKHKPAVKSKVKISKAAAKYLQTSNPTGPVGSDGNTAPVLGRRPQAAPGILVVQPQQGESIMDRTNPKAKNVTGHVFKKGTAAHAALLKSAGLAPATVEKPVTKKPEVTDQKRPYKK